MKLRLPQFLIAALLATQCGVNAYAEKANNGVDYVYNDAGKGLYNAQITIDSSVLTSEVGAVYKSYVGDTDLDYTRIKDVDITMTGGNITDRLAASPHNGMPVDGKVSIKVSGGTIGTLIGGHYLNTAFADSYGSESNIDSITIDVSGDTTINSLRGGNMISTDGGWPTDSFMQNYLTTGDINISLKGNVQVGTIYGTAWYFERVAGSLIIGANCKKVTELHGAYDGTVDKDVSVTFSGSDAAANMVSAAMFADVKGNAEVTINKGVVSTVTAGYDGTIGGNASVTINGGEATWIYSLASGTVEKDTSVIINGGEVGYAYAVTGGIVSGDAVVKITDGSVRAAYGVSNMYGMQDGKVKGDVRVEITGGEADALYGIQYGKVNGNVYITANGGKVTTTMRGLWDASTDGDVVVSMQKGEVSEVIGALGGSVGGDVVIDITDGKVQGNTSAVIGATVTGNATVYISGGEAQSIYCVRRGSVGGDASVIMTGGSVASIVGVGSDEYGLGEVQGDVSVHLLGGTVEGHVWGGGDVTTANSYTLYIGSEGNPYNGSVTEIKYFDRVVIASGSSISTTEGNPFIVTEQIYNVTPDNMTTALMSTSGNVSVDDKISITLNVPNSLRSGRYILVDASQGSVDTTNWTPEMVEIISGDTGASTYARVRNAAGEWVKVSFDDLKWENNILYLYQVKEDIKTPIASNWGAFKSAQAFVAAINGNRHNHVVIPTVTDNKGDIATSTSSGYSIAWGAAYGQNARIGGVGADYNIYGGAIGVEHHFVSKRSIGIAAGYDWGKISPFNMDSIDQETAHVALYGRAASWEMGQKGTVVIDWSAALSNTTSETGCISSDWEQKHMQLDARISYLHELTDKVTGYVFTGVQYYAAEDASADYVNISSLQNLRTEIGTGIIYKATQQTTLRAEASLYNDAMRHNPRTSANGASYSGTNPGRMGGSISAGVSYQLSDKWNLHGNYSFDVADDSTENNVNVGASFQF